MCEWVFGTGTASSSSRGLQCYTVKGWRWEAMRGGSRSRDGAAERKWLIRESPGDSSHTSSSAKHAHLSLTVALHTPSSNRCPFMSLCLSLLDPRVGLRANSDIGAFQNIQFTYKIWELKVIGSVKTLPICDLSILPLHPDPAEPRCKLFCFT